MMVKTEGCGLAAWIPRTVRFYLICTVLFRKQHMRHRKRPSANGVKPLSSLW